MLELHTSITKCKMFKEIKEKLEICAERSQF
jgi:hypothetical protein